MPLRNRVDPTGAIFRSTARGTVMGNRGGVIHNEARKIVRQYAGRRWITCLLQFKGRQRVVMSPRRYTELFFLDEAVSFAAGHRPCAECRRDRFEHFRTCWKLSRNQHSKETLYVDEIDSALHQARFNRLIGKLTYKAHLQTLPDGCFVQWENANYLLWKGDMCLWSPAGYLFRQPRATGTARVLTPEPLVECFRAGYIPAVHPSLQSLQVD